MYKVMKHLKNGIAAQIAVILLLVLIAFGAVMIAPVKAFAAEPSNMDSRSVIADLEGMTIDGKPFDTADYTGSDVQLVTIAEYCYSAKKEERGNYAVYLYVYNPQGVPADFAHGYVEIATAFDAYGVPTDYSKFELRAVSEYNYLFYKYRLDGDLIGDKLDQRSRKYCISGVEVPGRTWDGVKDCPVGQTFTYTGFAEGYGDAMPLSCTIGNLTTLALDVSDAHTTFRNDLDNADLTDRNQIDSVWFSVPNSLLNSNGGKLQQIKAEWWEYRTQPILITSDKTLYDDLKPWIGYTLPAKHSNEVRRRIGTFWDSGIIDQTINWSYNAQDLDRPAEPTRFNNPQPRLRWLFSTNAPDLSRYVIPGEKLIEYAEYYPYYSDGLKDWKKSFSADLFTADVGEGRSAGYNVKEFDAAGEIDLLKFDQLPGQLSDWHLFLSYFGLYKPTAPTELPSYAPIESLADYSFKDKTQQTIATDLLIGESDVSAVNRFVTESISKGETPFLFRYANTNYQTQRVYNYRNIGIGFNRENLDAIIASENVFFDFDILSLGFGDGTQVKAVIPVVMSPVDIFPDVEVPEQPENGLPRWVWLIIGILAVILLGVLCIFVKPLWTVVCFIVKLCWYIISAPFRFVAWIVRKCKDKGDKT